MILVRNNYTGNIDAINPAFITAIKPQKNGRTEVHYFGWSSFVGTNMIVTETEESRDSILKKIEDGRK